MATAKKSTSTKKASEDKCAKDEGAAKSVKRTRKVTPQEIVDVQSCVKGRLVFRSGRTGYKISWNKFGDINPMQVSDLLDMRNEAVGFFTKNLITVCGDRAGDVLDYLQVSKYYREVKTLDDLDDMILGDPKELSVALGSMSQSQKDAIVQRARALYDEGKLTTIKTAVEIRKATGVDISE